MLIKKVGVQEWANSPIPPQKNRDELGEYFSPIEKMFRERKGAIYAVLHVSETDRNN